MSRALERAGFAVDRSSTLADADLKLYVTDYDIAVLDRGLPDGDALELVRGLRDRGGGCLVLFVTAADAVPERVAGLAAGADDYLVKPFALDELVARVHALTRRATLTPVETELRVADVVLEPQRARVTRAGAEIELTRKEFILLHELMRRAGQVVSRRDLIEHCWDEHLDPRSNVVDVRIAALRRKLGDPPLIVTTRGLGYALVVGE